MSKKYFVMGALLTLALSSSAMVMADDDGFCHDNMDCGHIPSPTPTCTPTVKPTPVPDHDQIVSVYQVTDNAVVLGAHSKTKRLGTVTATCNEGDQAIGGGFSVVDADNDKDVDVMSKTPVVTDTFSEDGTSFVVTVKNLQGDPVKLTVTAKCLHSTVN